MTVELTKLQEQTLKEMFRIETELANNMKHAEHTRNIALSLILDSKNMNAKDYSNNFEMREGKLILTEKEKK